jgi:hypothetical protein
MKVQPVELAASIKEIKSMALPEGGFASIKGGDFRPDATAWAVIALRAYGRQTDIVYKAQQRLAQWQEPDGRIAASKMENSAYWPTPLAMLAWFNNHQFDEPTKRAVDFMLSISGATFTTTEGILGHDGSLKGWSWNEYTHSWVVPTSISLSVLKACGHESHERSREAVRLLVDRQLPSGGWNYGNTTVFENELIATPECTGHALNALAGQVKYEQISHSIEYLKAELPKLKSPLSLAWAILGLGAWSLRPVNSEELLIKCLKNQSRYGSYSTDLLSQVLIAHAAKAGLLSILEEAEK